MSQVVESTGTLPSFFDAAVAETLPEPTHLEHGLTIERVFSKEGENPFDSVPWHNRRYSEVLCNILIKRLNLGGEYHASTW